MRQAQLPNEAGMSRNDIIAAIKNAGYTLKGLSELNGLSPAAVSVCLSRPWPKVERIIADAISVPPHRIWPPRYACEGKPIKRGRKAVSSGTKKGATLLNNRPARTGRRSHS
jgi:Ner family transcriptional regulator